MESVLKNLYHLGLIDTPVLGKGRELDSEQSLKNKHIAVDLTEFTHTLFSFNIRPELPLCIRNMMFKCIFWGYIELRA